MATVQTQTTTQGNKQSNEALSVLLQQLMSGGTREQQMQLAARLAEVNRTTALRAQFSPEAARADATGLMSQQLRAAMESQLPAITRAAEGAGASQNAMRALLTQDALTRAAESSSALGVQAVQGYGSVAASLSSVLEGLTRPDDGITNALLQALQLMQQSTTTTETEGTGGGRGSSGGGSSGGGRTDSVLGMPSTDNFFYRPGGILSNAAQQKAAKPVVYGPSASDSAIADRIIKGLSPSQSASSVPNINALFGQGFQF